MVADSFSGLFVALGDSFTEGDGTPADSTWPKLLEKRLNAAHPSANITTLTGGIGGADPPFEYILLKEKLLTYQPDLVVVAPATADSHWATLYWYLNV